LQFVSLAIYKNCKALPFKPSSFCKTNILSEWHRVDFWDFDVEGKQVENENGDNGIAGKVNFSWA
jgi:hypothetical protein